MCGSVRKGDVMTTKGQCAGGSPAGSLEGSKRGSHGRIVVAPDEGRCLDTVQLNQLEQSFRDWVEESPRKDVRLSRRRVLLLFLIIRYTGAKLKEVLVLDPFEDIDLENRAIFFRGADRVGQRPPREALISERLAREIRSALDDPAFRTYLRRGFDVDPAFVRRKFYERAKSCGFSRNLGGPEMIRKARAVELMRNGVPLPAVQMLLGHSTPHLTSAYVSFSDEEMRQVTRRFVERESTRGTSARNTFIGKVQSIRRGDIQSLLVLHTLGGHLVTAVITNDSVERLGLAEGRLVTAEVKAPWVMLHRGDREPACTAENRFSGVIVRMTRGAINTEYAVRIADGTELCAVVSTESGRRLGLKEGDRAWVVFSCFSVVLQVD